MAHYIIRIGVPEASSHRFDELHNVRIALSTSEPENDVIQFKTVFVPRGRYREWARIFRLHFLLDSVPDLIKGYFRVELRLNELVSNGAGRSWRLFIGGCGSVRGVFKVWQWSWKSRKGYPTMGTMLYHFRNAITDYREKKGEKEFAEWIETMTPEGWDQSNPGKWFANSD